MKDIKALTKGIRNIIILRRRRKKRQPIGAGQRPEFILHRNPKSPVAEAYRMLRTNIQYLGATGKLRLLIVTSSGPREGKTTTVLNLGSAFAQANKRTLIVDSDLRNPSFHRLFNLNNDLGLTNVIAGQNRIDDVIHKDVLMPNLNVLTSGPKSKTPAEIIGSKNTADFMNTVKAAYDIIIFDSPPVLAVTDAQLLSVNADGVILVVQASKIAREVAKKARESLESVKANIIGVVLNNLDMSREHYYYYHKYYYSYPYPKGALSGEGRREEALLELKPEIREKIRIAKKKNLFIPESSYDDTGAPYTGAKDNIVTLLSEEEKKEGVIEVKGPVDKSSALGRKPVFFENKEKDDKAKPPDNSTKDKTGLGRKDMFDGLK